MKFQVYSRKDAEASNDLPHPHLIISLHGPGSQPKPAVNRMTQAMLSICTDDVDPTAGNRERRRQLFKDSQGRDWMPMTAGDAKCIIDFVASWKDRAATIRVHCEAGISRSSAVAAALAKWIEGDVSEANIRALPTLHPNPHIYSLMTKELRSRKLIPPRPFESDDG